MLISIICSKAPILTSFTWTTLYNVQIIFSSIFPENIFTKVPLQARRANKELPALGPDLSVKNERNFDQETMNKGASIVGMQAGGFKGANQEGMTFGRPRALWADSRVILTEVIEFIQIWYVRLE